MELHGLSIASLFIIFFIAVLLFGTKRLRSMVEDFSMAIRSFNKALRPPNNPPPKNTASENLEKDLD